MWIELDTKMAPRDVPSCGSILTTEMSSYLYIGKWVLRELDKVRLYSGAVCGSTKSGGVFDHRRCERCMRAVGAIW